MIHALHSTTTAMTWLSACFRGDKYFAACTSQRGTGPVSAAQLNEPTGLISYDSNPAPATGSSRQESQSPRTPPALQQTASLHHAAMHNAPVAITCFDMGGKCTYQNAASHRLLGPALASASVRRGHAEEGQQNLKPLQNSEHHLQSLHNSEHHLQGLLRGEPQALFELLQAVEDGRSWHGILQVALPMEPANAREASSGSVRGGPSCPDAVTTPAACVATQRSMAPQLSLSSRNLYMQPLRPSASPAPHSSMACPPLSAAPDALHCHHSDPQPAHAPSVPAQHLSALQTDAQQPVLAPTAVLHPAAAAASRAAQLAKSRRASLSSLSRASCSTGHIDHSSTYSTTDAATIPTGANTAGNTAGSSVCNGASLAPPPALEHAYRRSALSNPGPIKPAPETPVLHAPVVKPKAQQPQGAAQSTLAHAAMQLTTGQRAISSPRSSLDMPAAHAPLGRSGGVASPSGSNHSLGPLVPVSLLIERDSHDTDGGPCTASFTNAHVTTSAYGMLGDNQSALGVAMAAASSARVSAVTPHHHCQISLWPDSPSAPISAFRRGGSSSFTSRSLAFITSTGNGMPPVLPGAAAGRLPASPAALSVPVSCPNNAFTAAAARKPAAGFALRAAAGAVSQKALNMLTGSFDMTVPTAAAAAASATMARVQLEDPSSLSLYIIGSGSVAGTAGAVQPSMADADRGLARPSFTMCDASSGNVGGRGGSSSQEFLATVLLRSPATAAAHTVPALHLDAMDDLARLQREEEEEEQDLSIAVTQALAQINVRQQQMQAAAAASAATGAGHPHGLLLLASSASHGGAVARSAMLGRKLVQEDVDEGDDNDAYGCNRDNNTRQGSTLGSNGFGAAWGSTGRKQYQQPLLRYHDVHASTFPDPATGQPLILLVQHDVTVRMLAEQRMASALEAEHCLLENIFPRHVLQHAIQSRGGFGASYGLGNGSGATGSSPPQQHLRWLSVGKGSSVSVPPPKASLRLGRRLVTNEHKCVTILFADIVGFTPLCERIPAEEVMDLLNELFSCWDSLLDVYGVYKVETIGDAYMVAGGLMRKCSNSGAMTLVTPDESQASLHALRVIAFAQAMQREASKVLLPTTGKPVQIRVGIHSGPVVSGLIGQRNPRFCLFGDTVNTSNRMESTCKPGYIHASAATQALAPHEACNSPGRA